MIVGKLGGFFMTLAGPLAVKVMTALGFSLVAYAGVDVMVNQAISAAQSNWNSVGGVVATFVAMSGLNTAMSVMAGAISARVSLIVLKRWVPA